MSEVDSFLADITKEGSDPFEILEKDTPAESPAAKEPEKVEPEKGDNTSDKDVPFHKHPRWIEREKELKDLREKDEATAKELAELRTLTQETSKRLEPTGTIPDWFGGNEEAWKKFREYSKAERDEIKQELIAEQKAEQQKQVQDAARWNNWVASEIDKLKDEGHDFDRNKLIKTMLEYRPMDEAGNFDFKAGIKIYEMLEAKTTDPAKSQARKELADTTMRTSGQGEKTKDYQTAKDLRHRSWGSL